jgi:hypothetical protein
MKNMYEVTQYPEDIKEWKKAREWSEEFKKYSPDYNPEYDDKMYEEEEDEFDEEIDIKETDYGWVPDYWKTKPITRNDSNKKRD